MLMSQRQKNMLDAYIQNQIRLISALFDANNGEISIDVSTLNNAELRYHIVATENKENNKITFKKVNGISDEALNTFYGGDGEKN